MESNFKIKTYINPLGALKTFVLRNPYVERWEEFEKSLKLEQGKFPTEENFKVFVTQNNISIGEIDDSSYGLVVFPW
jgi:hypothetical protein